MNAIMDGQDVEGKIDDKELKYISIFIEEKKKN